MKMQLTEERKNTFPNIDHFSHFWKKIGELAAPAKAKNKKSRRIMDNWCSEGKDIFYGKHNGQEIQLPYISWFTSAEECGSVWFNSFLMLPGR